MLTTSCRVEDTSSRYVAEDNVILLSAQEILAMERSESQNDGAAVETPVGQDNEMNPSSRIEDRFPIEIGKYFKRFDREHGVFVSNVLDEFPED